MDTSVDRGGAAVREAARLLDAHAPAPVLVHGSPPDVARDLDVLARTDTFAALEVVLEGAGFERIGGSWIRIDECRPVEVELTDAATWSLPDEELADLFSSAEPIDGYAQLLRPAPRHELLILARRLTQHAGALGARNRARLRAAVDADPKVWEHARALADRWGCRRSLEVLARAAAPDGRVSRIGALAGRVEERRRGGASTLGAYARAAASFLERPRRGAVVSLSGIDGAGKSTQAALLASGLAQAGHDSVVEWARITTEPSLKVIALPVKKLLSVRSRLSRGSDGPRPRVETTRSDPSARELRERSRLVGGAWAGIVAVVNARTMRRNTLKHLRAGRIVVRDRYLLDSLVQLEWKYANGRDLGWQARLIRAIVPTPLVSCLLDVPPEQALARKPDDYDLDQLRLHRDTYRRHAEQVGAHIIDGSQSRDEICAMVLRTTLRELAARDQ